MTKFIYLKIGEMAKLRKSINITHQDGGSESKESACNAGDPSLISGSGIPLEKGMAIHSCFLAWEVPWTDEPCGLQSVWSQRVGHD